MSKKKFIVRTSTSYDIELEADSEADAVEQSMHIPFDNWGQTQEAFEAEEVD